MSLAFEPPVKEVASDYIATTPGTKWVYRDRNQQQFTVILTKTDRLQDRTVITLEAETKDGKTTPKEQLAISKTEVQRVGAVGRPVEPPLCLLKLAEDRKAIWETTQRSEFYSVRGVNKMLGVEDIVVPAGKFKALRIETEVIITGGLDEHRNRETNWYAREVGLVKSVLNGSTTELVEFTRGKK